MWFCRFQSTFEFHRNNRHTVAVKYPIQQLSLWTFLRRCVCVSVCVCHEAAGLLVNSASLLSRLLETLASMLSVALNKCVQRGFCWIQLFYFFSSEAVCEVPTVWDTRQSKPFPVLAGYGANRGLAFYWPVVFTLGGLRRCASCHVESSKVKRPEILTRDVIPCGVYKSDWGPFTFAERYGSSPVSK